MREHLQFKVKGKGRRVPIGVCFGGCVYMCLMRYDIPRTGGKKTIETISENWLEK